MVRTEVYRTPGSGASYVRLPLSGDLLLSSFVPTEPFARRIIHLGVMFKVVRGVRHGATVLFASAAVCAAAMPAGAAPFNAPATAATAPTVGTCFRTVVTDPQGSIG